MASDEYFRADLEDPELKGDVDYSFFGDENDGDGTKLSADEMNNKNKFADLPITDAVVSDSSDSTTRSNESFRSNRDKEKSKSPDSYSSYHSKSSKSSASSDEMSNSKKSNSPKNESPRLPSPKSRKSNSKSASLSSKSASPPRSPSPSSKSSSSNSSKASMSRLSKSKSPTPQSSAPTSSRSVEEKLSNKSSNSKSSTSKSSTSKSASKKSGSKDDKASSVIKISPPRRRGSHDDSDTTVTSLSEDSPATSPKSRKKKSMSGSQQSTSRNEKEDLNSQRDADIINAGLVMKAMLALDRERKSKARSHEAWLDPLSRNRNPSEVINVEAENKRLVNYLTCGPNLRSSSGNLITRPHHSTINRQEYQRKIETENRSMINRLSVIHPTPGMRRTDQLSFYRIQSAYGVIPLDKAPLRRAKLTANPLRISSSVRRNNEKASAKYPKTFKGAQSSRPEWISGW